MLKTILVALLSFNFFFTNGSGNFLTELGNKTPKADSGTLEKMIVSDGSVSMNLDVNRLNGGKSKDSLFSLVNFDVERDSFFTVIVFNNDFRGILPSSMKIIPQGTAGIPSRLSGGELIVEHLPFGEQYELAVRDAKTGFVLFYIEGQMLDFEPNADVLNLRAGRLLLSKEFATELGRPSETGTTIGNISFSARLRPIEVSQIVDGEIASSEMPGNASPLPGTVPGPDVVVGDVYGLAQFGSSGTQVGLAVGTNSCNFGVENLNWFALPSNDHPVIPQNMYRMSGGSDNKQRFEQIGQSSVKHAFTALTQNLCGLGCNGTGGSRLGSGCSDPYSASLNSGPNLGSRAWINPFTGAYPRGDSATPPNNHGSHSHNGTSHRILVEQADLNTTMNPGATYFAEGQYVTPHEYAWCQSNPGQCNMYNNVSYRQYNVSGTTSFSFSPAAETVRTKPAIEAWTGATIVRFEPQPGADGIGFVAYKVTNPSPGVWHYEYAVYNQNLDRAIQSFSVPTGTGVTLSNIGFHAPPQHPGSPNDGTLNSAGYSSTPWAQSQTSGAMTWNTETFAQNQNANAIRWGTMYNFRFDSNRPPQTMNATLGFFKTGQPITVQVQGPTPAAAANVSVSGRVTTSEGRGVLYGFVTMTDSNNNVRTAITNPFGYYRFENVSSGANYTFNVFSKRYTFQQQVVTVNDHISNLNFVANPE